MNYSKLFVIELKYRRGHVTGQVQNRGRSETGLATIIISSQSSDLAKLNPICHMDYSIIFTEISFYPETSKAYQMGIWWLLMPDTTDRLFMIK